MPDAGIRYPASGAAVQGMDPEAIIPDVDQRRKST